MKLLVVESPTKVKTIGKYLGSGYKILASFGHVRDLPSKNGSVDVEKDFKMLYQIKSGSKKHIDAIVSAAKKSSEVLLATDPDREGESIAWSVSEVLKERKAIDPKKISRVSFSEITPNAVKKAISNPRLIDEHLVEAQQARLSLDYLVGFNISPVLWKKLPGSRSAGRVQSVASRLIAERESEIKQFKPKEYWTIDIEFKQENTKCLAKVIEHDTKKFGKDYPTTKEETKKIENDINKVGVLVVSDIAEKPFKQNPYPPFITSTLQQAAFQSYSFTSKRTMQTAQRLYEGVDIGNERVGLITYMRTDGFGLSNDALSSIRTYIKDNFSNEFLPEKPLVYKTKVKNAQEAHEAIRPTNISITPTVAEKYLSGDDLKLYIMIWRRAVACQMAPAVKVTKSIKLSIEKTGTIATMSQTIIKFPGFLQIYRNLNNSDNDIKENLKDDFNNIFSLPNFEKGQNINIDTTISAQHFTAPPPRFNESSLIKKMEELGIGRPSTYSSIVNIIQDRGYVELSNKQFHASTRGMIVTAFLKCFATKYVEYDFTASLEHSLDEISSGNSTKLTVLNNFWKPFFSCMKNCEELDYHKVSEALSNDLKGYLFHINADGEPEDCCVKCKEGKMLINIGRFGPYLRCSRYPDCDNTVRLSQTEDGYALDEPLESEQEPILYNGKKMKLKKGPYGKYVEVIDGDKKHNRSIPKSVTDIDEKTIILYGSLPRVIGEEEGLNIIVGVGPFGPYVSHNKVYASIKIDQIDSIKSEEAMLLIKKKIEKIKSKGKVASSSSSKTKKKTSVAIKSKKTTHKKTTKSKKAL